MDKWRFCHFNSPPLLQGLHLQKTCSWWIGKKPRKHYKLHLIQNTTKQQAIYSLFGFPPFQCKHSKQQHDFLNECLFAFCRGPYLEQRGREELKQEWFTKYFSFWAQKKHYSKCISPHTHTHTHRFSHTSVCFSDTQAHRPNRKRNMGSSPAMPSLTLPQSSTKKCFSNTCLTSSLWTLACWISFV